MDPELSDKEKRIIKSIIKLNGKGSTKKIAKGAEMSPATASKYLSVLEVKGVIKKDNSQLPYLFWEIVNEDIL